MTYPSLEQVSVAIAALRTEANEWDAQGVSLRELSAKIAAMEFGRLEAGLFQLMVAPYNDVIRGLADRCAEGSAAMAEVATTLRNVADVYRTEDEANMHRIKNVY